MRGERLLRMMALIALCAMVWYFSYDQGRMAMKPRVEGLQKALDGKERIIQGLSMEIRMLKEQMAEERRDNSNPDNGGEDVPDRLTIRQGASRILFDGRVLLTCLSIDRDEKKARLQINLVKDEKLMVEWVPLGQAMRYSLEGRAYAVVVEELHTSMVGLRIMTL